MLANDSIIAYVASITKEMLVEQTASKKAVGGHARAKSLTGTERRNIAQKAAETRWSATKATHSGELEIGELKIPCAVLPDGTRVLSQRGVGRAMGRSFGGSDWRQQDDSGAGKLPFFLAANSLRPFISNELMALVTSPLTYRHTQGGGVAHGVAATALPMICDVWLKARDAGVLNKTQLEVAQKADLLMRGLAHVGIVALVDEATGYQRDRSKNALAKILEAFIAKELQPWVKTFPDDYYNELFRLRGMVYPQDTPKRPRYFGLITNDIVYKRLAPGVLEELKRVVPKHESGRHKSRFSQNLTRNIGYPKLREHLGAVVAFMKLSKSYHDFIEKLDAYYPRFGENYSLALEGGASADDQYQKDRDDGKGL